MSDRQISPVVSAIWLFIASSYALAESQSQYAEKAHESWQQQNESMDRSYSRLLSEAEAEPSPEQAQQLRQAKERWDKFQNLFCKSVSKTYGGQWSSVHESECRMKLEKQLQDTVESYDW